MVAHHACIHRKNLRIGLTPHFTVANTSHRIGVTALYEVPEVICQIVIIGIPVGDVRAQRSYNHWDVLIGMTRTDVINVFGHRIKEGGGIKTIGCFNETGLFGWVAYHLWKTGKGFGHSAHLACDVHIPHLVSVARTGLSGSAVTIDLHICPVVHAVPYPQAHVFGNQQRFLGNSLIVNIVGDVYESCQLFVNGVIGRPYPIFIIVRAVAFNQSRMCCGDSIQVAITIVSVVFFVLIKCIPVSFHLFQFLFWCIVTCLPIAI